MKRIIFLLLIISSTASAQVDSTKLNVVVTASLDNWATWFGDNLIDLSTVAGETLYDKVKAPVRANNSIALTTRVASDTMDAIVFIKMYLSMRSRPYYLVAPHWAEFITALRGSTGTGSAYLKRFVARAESGDAAEAGRTTTKGLNRLKRIEE